MEPELAFFWSQARLPVEQLGHQPSYTGHQTDRAPAHPSDTNTTPDGGSEPRNLHGLWQQEPQKSTQILTARGTQNFLEWPTYDWSNLRPMPHEVAHASHYLEGQESEVG